MSDLPPPHQARVTQRLGWTIRVLQSGSSYVAECISPEGNVHRSQESSKRGDAYNQGCSLVDREIAAVAAKKRSAAIKPFVLMLLYLTGADEFYNGKFVNRKSWIKYEFDILDDLEQDKLLTQPQKGIRQRTYISLNKEGIKTAREMLRNLNFTGIYELLNELERHDMLSDGVENQEYLDDAKEKD